MGLWKDVVYATRRLLGKPGFLAIALLTLALGVGFNAAIFTFVNGFLVRPLPIDNPNRVFTLGFGKNQLGPQVSYPDYLDIRDRNQVFASAAAMRVMPMALSLTGQSERIWGYLVSGNYFELLGIAPWRGRFLTPQDDGTAPSPVAVVSYACWQRRFGADPEIVGRSVKVNGEKFTIVGVAPPGFLGTERFFASDIWVPFSVIQTIEGRDWRTSRSNRNAWSIGRLKPGISMTQAEASLGVLAAQMASEHPDVSEGFTIHLSPPGLLGPLLRRSVMGMALALLVVAGLTLLVACTNLSGLVLAHAADRRKEIAYSAVQRTREIGIRVALGARAASILGLLLRRTMLLVAFSGLIGIALSVFATRLLAQVLYGKPDPSVYAPVVALLVGISVVACLVPARRVLKIHPSDALRHE